MMALMGLTLLVAGILAAIAVLFDMGDDRG